MTFALNSDERAVLGLRFDGSRLKIRCAISERIAGAAHIVVGALIGGFSVTQTNGLRQLIMVLGAAAVVTLGIALTRPKLIVDCGQRTLEITNRFRTTRVSLDEVSGAVAIDKRFAFGRWPISSVINGPKVFVIGEIRTTMGKVIPIDAASSAKRKSDSTTWADIKTSALNRMISEIGPRDPKLRSRAD